MTKVRNPKSICLTFVMLAGMSVAGCAPHGGEQSGLPTTPPAPAAATEAAPAKLAGGAASIDALVADFLDALGKNDAERLRSLRVTESEYRNGILPWNVEPGNPPQKVRADVVDYFWDAMNTKSLYTETTLLHRYGGKKLTLKDRTDQGEVQYAGFKATKRLRLHVLEEGNAEELEIATGSVAEVDGRFKFVSIQRD